MFDEPLGELVSSTGRVIYDVLEVDAIKGDRFFDAGWMELKLTKDGRLFELLDNDGKELKQLPGTWRYDF